MFKIYNTDEHMLFHTHTHFCFLFSSTFDHWFVNSISNQWNTFLFYLSSRQRLSSNKKKNCTKVMKLNELHAFISGKKEKKKLNFNDDTSTITIMMIVNWRIYRKKIICIYWLCCLNWQSQTKQQLLLTKCRGNWTEFFSLLLTKTNAF